MTFIQGTVISTQVLVQLLFAWLGKCRIYLNEIHLRRNLKHILHLTDFLRITFHISFGSSKSFLILVASFSKSLLILVASFSKSYLILVASFSKSFQIRFCHKFSPKKLIFCFNEKSISLSFFTFTIQLTINCKRLYERKI